MRLKKYLKNIKILLKNYNYTNIKKITLEVYKIFSALRLSRTDRTTCWQFTAISSLLCGVIYRVQTSHKLTKDLGVYKTTYSRAEKEVWIA